MLWTVVAYRWGWLNGHHYMVAATSDESEAHRLAKEECNDRGGKYGVLVLQWLDTRSCITAGYYPSIYGEDAPHENHELRMFERIGRDAHSAAVSGLVWSPGPDRVLKAEPVDAPDWLKRSFVRHEADHLMGRYCDSQEWLADQASLEEKQRKLQDAQQRFEKQAADQLAQASAKRDGLLAATAKAQGLSSL